MFRKLRKAIYVGAGVLGVAAVVAYAVMSTAWFRRALERRVVAAVEAATGGRVEVREFYFRPIVLEMEFRGFVLHGTEPHDAAPLFSAEALVVGFSPAGLLERRVAVRSLDWDKAEVRLRTAPDGATNLPGPKVSADAGRALNDLLNLSIGRVTFLHTSLFWNQQRVPFDLSARDVAFQLHRHFMRGYVGSVSSSRTTIVAPNWSLPPTTVAAQFHFRRTEFAIESLLVRSAAFAAKCTMELKTVPSLEATVSYSADGGFPELGRVLQLPQVGAGKVTLAGEADYRQGHWTSQGQAQALQLAIPNPTFHPGRIDISAHYTADRRHLTLPDLKITVLGGTAQGTAEITFDGRTPAFELRTQIRGLDAAQALQSFPGLHTISHHLPPASNVGGKLSATWKGRLNDFKSQFDLQFTPAAKSAATSLPMEGMARGTASLAGGLRVELEEARVRTPYSSIAGHGTVGESDSDLSVQLTTTNFEEGRALAEFLTQASEPIPLQLKSAVTFTGTVRGPITATDIRGRVEVGSFVYHGWTWDGFAAGVGATRTYTEISAARLRRGTSELTFDANARLSDWRLDRAAPVHLALGAKHASIEGLQATLGVAFPIDGDVTGSVTVDGPLSNLTGSGQIQIGRGHAFQIPIDSLSAKLRVAGPALDLDDIQLAKGSGHVTGHARIAGAQPRFAGEFHGRDFCPADFGPILRDPKLSAALGAIEGHANFDLTGQASHENVELKSAWEIRDVKMYGMPVGNLHGHLDWHSATLQLQVENDGAGGRVRLAGSVRTQGDWPLEVSGEYADFRADPWIRALAEAKLNARVTASGTVTVNGPLKDPERLEADSQIKSLEIGVGDLVFANGALIDLRYAGGELSARRFQMRGPSTNLQVEGSIRFGAPPALSLTASGESEATLVSLLDPALHASGRSQLNLRVSGSPSKPVFRGAVKVQELSLGYGDLPFRLSGLNGQIDLDGDRAAITSLRGQVGGGIATLNGFLTFGEAPRFEVTTDLDQVRVQYPADFTSLLTGKLRLSGTANGGQLEGDLIVRQMFASESFNVLTLIGEAAANMPAPANVASSPLASKVRLNIRVSSDPEVRLETHDLRVAAQIDVGLKGTFDNPVQVGTVHILSGEALLRGNRYRLNRGDISMTNPFRTQPVLSLEARTRVQRYDVTVDISGPFDQMKVGYRSDPPLPAGDIISLLALGYARETTEQSTVATARTSTVGATALLSQALASQKTGRIQRLFGVSSIKIDPNVGGPTNIAGARVTVEQQVTHDLMLTYATNTAGAQQQVVQFEWALSERASIFGVRDQNGIFGLELRFRRRFK